MNRIHWLMPICAILYDRELEDFVVSHSRPYAVHNGEPLKLETLLAQHTAAGFFWLDAKDLRKLSPFTARKATQPLAALIDRHGLVDRAFVESSSALYLSWLDDTGIHTSYAVTPNDQKYSAPVYWPTAAVSKLGYVFGGADATSMGASRYTAAKAASFGKASVLLSTVNDEPALRRLSAMPEVKVILSDHDHYAMSDCLRSTG